LTEEKFQKVVTLVDSYLVHELALIVARFLTPHEFFTELRFPGFVDSVNPIRKVLILNTGESGSSTLFKQINILYGRLPDLLPIREHISLNVVQGFLECISELPHQARPFFSC
jgi:hypothetical protein